MWAIQSYMNWEELKVFLSVAESGSLSRAARQLEVSQPTLSRRIAALERTLGVRLFRRTSRGLKATPAAERILSNVRRMDEEAALIELETRGGGALEGRVRVTASEGLAVEWLTAELLTFHRSCPGIRVDVVADKSPLDLVSRDADIALRLFRSPERDLFQRRVARHVLGLFAAPSYLDQWGTPRTLGDLVGHRFVDLDEPYSHYEQSTWLAQRVGQEQIVYRSNSLLGLLAATRAGWGIGVHSRFLGRRDRSLVSLLPGTNVDESDLWLVTHAGLRRSPRIRAAYEFIGDLVTTHRSELEGRS